MKEMESMINTILQKSSIDECGLHELQSLARQYPYFAPFHLMLAEKIKTLDESLYEYQLEKASLYVHNPLWLDYQVLKIKPCIETIYAPDVLENNNSDDSESFQNDSLTTEINNEEITDGVQDENKMVSGFPEVENPSSENIFGIEDEKLVNEETINDIESETLVQDKIEIEEINKEKINDNTFSAFSEEVNAEDEKLEKESDPGAGEEKISEANTFEQPVENNDQLEELNIEEKEIPVVVQKELVTTMESDYDEEAHYDIPLEDEEKENQEDGPSFNFPQLKIEPLKETGGDLLFEPFHTVDYFASQGIKTITEDKPKDRLSLQLKSFTEWIKSMKKLPTGEIENNLDEGSEEKIQLLATDSIADRAVFTEAMAEVWLKQGNNEKALEIYQKLSLQNPAKSPYFAAKIESLKNI